MSNDKKCAVVIVTYNPNINAVLNMIESLKRDAAIIIVDNSSEDFSSYYKVYDSILYIPLMRNFGIAYAQNLGIFTALKNNCDYVITFDQDSNPNDNFIKDMLNSFCLAEKEFPKEKIACVGPKIIQKGFGNTESEYHTTSFEHVDFIISSGAIFKVSNFISIGLNKSEWFIDLIDVEWCARARRLGFSVLRDNEVELIHNIDNDYPTLFGRVVRLGTPTRQYYLIRNWIFSLTSNSFSLKEKAVTLYHLFSKIPLFCLVSPRRKRIVQIFKGIVDGVLGRVSTL